MAEKKGPLDPDAEIEAQQSLLQINVVAYIAHHIPLNPLDCAVNTSNVLAHDWTTLKLCQGSKAFFFASRASISWFRAFFFSSKSASSFSHSSAQHVGNSAGLLQGGDGGFFFDENVELPYCQLY